MAQQEFANALSQRLPDLTPDQVNHLFGIVQGACLPISMADVLQHFSTFDPHEVTKVYDEVLSAMIDRVHRSSIPLLDAREILIERAGSHDGRQFILAQVERKLSEKRK